VWGLRRDPSGLPRGIEPLEADFSRREVLVVMPEGIDYAVYCVSATEPTKAAYRLAYLDGLERFLRALSDQGERPRRVFFTSSTSVYGQENGEWIDEESAPRPTRYAGEITLLAERLLLARDVPATVVRLGGIYGPGRTGLIDRVVLGEAGYRPGPPHYTNRIHRDDAAGLLRHLMSLPPDGVPLADVYLGVDCEPADEADVLRFLANELGGAAPRELEPGAEASPRRAGSKRCRNDRLLETGYRFRYPTYREGYRALLAARRDSPA